MQCSSSGSVFRLLVRIALGLYMFLLGWHLVFDTVTVTTEQLRVLGDDAAVAVVRMSDTATTPDAAVERKAVTGLAVDMHAAGITWGTSGIAWSGALVLLVGGALMCVGLLTRLWGLLAMVITGGLIWTQTCYGGALGGADPLAWAANALAFERVFAQSMALLLGLYLLVKGPGGVSLDHFLFGRRPAKDATTADEA